jgi:hypothetical protein
LLLAVLGIISLLRNQLTPPSQQRYRPPPQRLSSPPWSCYCGSNTTAALSIGCRLDTLAMAWLPPHCRDDELTAEFDLAGDNPDGSWTYWADNNFRRALSPAEVGALADDPAALVYMTRRWHEVHCLFYWKKEFRTRWTGKVVERRYDTEGHVKHCAKLLLNPVTGEQRHTTASSVAMNADLPE